MVKNIPTLTIAIPTYNRADSLKYIVNKIAPYLSENLKLLIIDNNSSDDTQKYISHLSSCNTNKAIEYIRNSANVGGGSQYVKMYRIFN